MLLALLLALVAARQADATVMYPNYTGTSVTFTGIQETTNTGDPEPLFGTPTGVGDQLLFFSPSFVANTGGAGGFDATGAQLQALITGNGGILGPDTIDKIVITEFGDTTLNGGGTASTFTTAGIAGQVTVLATTAGAIVPVIINIGPANAAFDLVALPGTNNWTLGVTIDIASVVPNATQVQLSYNNQLNAFSEAGTTAQIQKKVTSGPAAIVVSVPEPGSLALVGSALLALVLRFGARRRS
jgi:hypothetical protein